MFAWKTYPKHMKTNSKLDPTQPLFVTVCGTKHYHGTGPFLNGTLLRCEKDFENQSDPDAIRVHLPFYDTVGYIANSTYTVEKDTRSASRIYDLVEDRFYVRVMLTINNRLICKIENRSFDELEVLLIEQMSNFPDVPPTFCVIDN